MNDSPDDGSLRDRITLLEATRRAAEEALQASEERFHHLVDAVTDYAIFLLEPSGNVATWNEGAKRIKGYDASEIIGRHFSAFYTREDREAGKPARVLESVRRNGRFEEESWRVRKDGTRFWASVVITALRGPQGEIKGFAKVTRDLTARRAAEESERRLAEERFARAAAEGERNRLLALFERVPAVVNFLRGPELVFEIAHPKAGLAFGRRELAGKPLLEAIPEYRDQPEIVGRIRRVYETGEASTSQEFPLRLTSGGVEKVSYWDSAYVPVRDAAGAIEGVMTFELDVTESVLARQQVERTHRSLQALTGLAFALAAARSPADVAEVLVDQGMRLSQADTCVVQVLDESGTALELLVHRGIDPAIADRLRHITAADDPARFEFLRSGVAQWAETAAEYERMYPALARMNVPGPRARAFWSIPLQAEGGAVGVLGMGFYAERRFPADERALIETMAQQCAQALLRAVRAEREQRALARFATTLRSIGDGVITTDTDGRVTLMNVIAEQLTGWSEAEARGRPLSDVFAIASEETGRPCENPVEQVLREGKIIGLANHTVLRSRAGRVKPIADSAAPIRDTAGALFGVVLVFRDVTAEYREQARRDFLARAGAALASSLDYRSTLSSVAQFAVPRLADWCTVHLVEPGGHVPQLVAMAHADPEQLERLRELMERYPIDAEGPSGVPRVIRTAHSELYPDLGGVLAEFSGGNPDGLRILRQLDLRSAMIVPLRGRDRTLGALAFTYAQSERSYTEQDLAFAEEFARRAAMAIENAQAVRQAERAQAEEQRLRHEADLANQAKDEFLATVSHELRTPLNAILGWTATLRGRKPPAELDRPLAIIERNARRQARLIEDVLDVSRIISGKLTLNVGPTNVAETIEGAIESIAPAAEAKQIGIRSDLDPRVTIAADGDRLQQVVWNLLSNAVKFTPKGGSVEIAMYREGPEVCIRVSDTGEGIPRDALPIIFEPFRQADASTTRKHGGLGLGLAIVRQLVAAHGGTIRAESDGPGMGATFVAAFPAGGAVSIGAGSAAESPAPGATTMGATKEAPRLEGLRVLVVDDEEDARDIVAEILREKGATVTTAASATQALEMIAQLQPDVMVSDVAMPEMDGLTLLRKLRALPANRGGRTPALALSAYARREDAQRAFGAGFQMHAAKPVEPAQLVAMVANLAGLSLEAPSPE